MSPKRQPLPDNLAPTTHKAEQSRQDVRPMWLPADIAAVCAVVLFGVGLLLRRRVPAVANASREAACVFTLYAMWRLFNRVDVRLDGAAERGKIGRAHV